jgi:hypothetical protein
MRGLDFLRAVVFLSLCSGYVQAAEKNEEKKTGYFLYANAVGEKGWSFLVLDGEDINPKGMEPGYRSSWVSFAAGEHELQFEHQPLGLVDSKVKLQPGGLHAFITYSDVEAQDDRGRPPRPILAVMELRCDLVIPKGERRGSRLIVVNLTPAPVLRVRIGEEVTEVPRSQETVIGVSRIGGVVEVGVLPSAGLPESTTTPASEGVDPGSVDDSVFDQSLNFEDAGNRFVVFYIGVQNVVQSLVFDDIGMLPGGTE